MPQVLCTETCEPKLSSKLDRSAPLCVCFVCTGNTCRSPMAQAVANALAEQEVACFPPSVQDCVTRRLVANSAGLYAASGAPISERAVEALEEAEIVALPHADYHSHTAHTVTAEDVARADYLVGMSANHAMELLMRFPEAASKILCMPHPIADPYGGDLACYRACLAEIEEGVKKLFFSEAQP